MSDVKVASTVNIENKEIVEQEKEAEKITVQFSKPYRFEGESYSELDLTKLNELKGRDLQNLYKRFVQKTGLNISNPGLAPEYAFEVANLVTGKPIEFFYQMPLKDSTKVQNTIVNFLYAGE